jgi:hypothetical protein
MSKAAIVALTPKPQLELSGIPPTINADTGTPFVPVQPAEDLECF